MPIDYLPVLFMVGFVAFGGVMALIISSIVRPKNPYAEKLTPWECGMEPIGGAVDGHFRIHFFVVAILFIIFDVETLFLFPWAVIITDASISTIIFVEMVVFLFVLAIGLVYAWAKGALDWIK